MKETREHLDAGGDVFGRGVFVRVMGKPAAATHEDHAHGANGGERDRIVTGTAGKAETGAGDGLRGIQQPAC